MSAKICRDRPNGNFTTARSKFESRVRKPRPARHLRVTDTRTVVDAAVRDAVVSARVGRLATVSGPGRPHVVPVCFALLGEVVYTAVDHKPKKTSRLRRITNLQATGSACLLVDAYEEDWSKLWWVRLDGRGRVVADGAEVERAVGALVAKYAQYRERQPGGPVLALDITRWTAWSAR